MPKNRSTSIPILLIGLFLTGLALVGLYLGDNTLFNAKPFSLTSPDGDQLNGTYYPGDQDVAILLVEGFNSDQVSMRSLAAEFNNAGFNVFTFDFPGQGSSSGSLTFDNTQTDRLANDVLLIEKNISQISEQANLPLIVVGHGLGGRAALQAAVIDSRLIQGLVLIGPQLNLSSDQQPELFTRTVDRSLPWIQLMNPTIPNTRVLILSGAQDDVFSPDSASLLLRSLTGDLKAGPGVEISSSAVTDASRLWMVFPDQLNYSEIYDARTINAALAWSQAILKMDPVVAASFAADMRGWLWVLAIIGIFIAGEGSRRAILHRIRHRSPNLHGVDVTNLRQFLWGKLLFWLAAVPLMAILAGGLTLLIPLPKPVFSLYYVAFIGSYGLLMLIAYRYRLLPGTYGKFQFSTTLKIISWRRVILTLEVNLAMLAILALYTNSGWYSAPPGGIRLLWLLIFTPFTALGFWISHLEIDLIKHKFPETQISPALVTINSLLPFFIYIIVMGSLGSSNGVVSGLQGLVVLMLVHIQGTITYRLTGYRWLTAILQAVMLYLLILPTTALFNF